MTDFYLAEDRHSALRQAYEAGLAVIRHIRPRTLAGRTSACSRGCVTRRLLREAGLDPQERAHLLRTIPATEIVERDAADELWRRRKELFFKPVDGYGGKAAYRGDKLTRVDLRAHPL